MSLVVWLPLDGDLRNQGCSNLEFTYSGANISIENSGKIGKCYKRTTSAADAIISNNTINLGTQQSMFCWIKMDSFQSSANLTGILGQHRYSTNTGMGITLKYASSTTGYASVNTGTGSSRTYNTYYGNTLLSAGIWYHIGYTYDGSNIKIYVNGQLDKTQAFTGMSCPADYLFIGNWALSGSTGSGITNYSAPGCINDVRIYNHCLSAAEVKEIAQGLVLHYKLDDPYIENTTNLSSTSAGGWNNSGTCVRTTNDTTILNPPTSSNTYSIRATSDGSMALTCGTTNSNLPSKTIIASTYIWLDGTQDSSTVYLRSTKTDGSAGLLKYKNNSNPSTWPQRQWIRINTDAITTASDATTFYICTYINKNTEVRAVNGWQIEEKDHVTPWTAPNTTRTTGIVQDSSGYGHNGTITGNIITNSSTPRYNVSTNFPDSACSIGIGNLSTMIPESIFTFNIWFKKITGEWSSKNYETILGGPDGFELEAKVGATNSPVLKYYSWGGGTTNYTLDEWHMITMVRTTANTQFYLDGELKVTGSAGSIPSGDYFIGAWRTATQQNYRGYLSDARIYCTPLLDKDIKLLYNTSMRVDNSQGIHSFEFDESGSRELLQGINITSSYDTHSSTNNPYTKYQNGELYFDTNGSSAGSDYIPISPSGKTYYYDIEISINTGNQFYVGFERYDANKTSRSNNACNYIITTKPTTDITHKHYFGTVDLSTDGTNPCAFIALRILNGWSGTTSGVTGIATIHRMSLREVTTLQKLQIGKNGITTIDELKEYQTASIYKNGLFEANNFIEN